MRFSPLTARDLSLIPTIQPDGWDYDITSKVQDYVLSDFCYPIKLNIDGRLAGMGATILHGNVAWLGHIIVHPDFRGRGLGRLITQTLIDSPEVKDCETISLIATDMGEPVYTKLGFEMDAEYIFFKDLKLPDGIVQSTNIYPYNPHYKQQLAALDRTLSGEDRMNNMEQFLPDGFVYLNNEIVQGFYLPRFGEGLIVARNDEAGIALMKWRLQEKNSAIFPKENTAAAALMHEYGHESHKSMKRMWLRKSGNWQPNRLYNRIGGNVG